MDVGFELRQAREQRGMSLQEISSTTRISMRVLQAIESSDASRLLANVFTRSFVKTYAAQVGLDPAETARRYLDQFEPPPAPETADGTAESIPDTTQDWVTPARQVARLLHGRFGTVLVLAMTALTAIALVVRSYKQARTGASSHGAPAPIVRSAPVVTAPPAPARALPPTPVATSGTTPPIDVLHLAIAPTGPCWVQATVNGHRVLAKLLGAGDRPEVDAPSDVTLRVGEPGTFAFTINGAPARLPAAAGHPVTVHVNKENYRTFLTR